VKNLTRKEREECNWNLIYSETLATRDDFEPGRICWDTARTLRVQGNTAALAALFVQAPYKSPGAR
jgi:hypothetical protein